MTNAFRRVRERKRDALGIVLRGKKRGEFVIEAKRPSNREISAQTGLHVTCLHCAGRVISNAGASGELTKREPSALARDPQARTQQTSEGLDRHWGR